MSLDTLLKSVDQIHDKITTTSAKTATELQRLTTDQRELAERLVTLEQRRGMQQEAGEGAGRATLGDCVWTELEKNAELLAKTRSIRFEVKAAADPITTANGRNIVVGLFGGPGPNTLGLQLALRTVPVFGVTALEYSRYTGKEGAAAQQAAEGDSKAYVRPTHTLVTQKALTIAGLTKISAQALADRAELAAVVNNVLRREVDIALDVALTNGATDFTGGFEALATAYTSLVYTAMVDAISEGVSTMQTAGFAPDVVALNPADWLAVTVAKGTANDHYLSGAYLSAMPMEMRGLRVVLSASVDAGKALLMDSQHCELRLSNTFGVEVAYSGDDFERNLMTVRGEMRVVPVFRSTGAARLITPKAP